MLDEAMAILDHCYKNGIMVIMNADEHGGYNTGNIETVVNVFKEHPAILMWALGHEWNLDMNGYYHQWSFTDGVAAMQDAAARVKAVDAYHPVCSVLGDIMLPSPVEIADAVNTICPAVDLWGTNTYRGEEFYDLFTRWQNITMGAPKPLLITEFGADSFHTEQWSPPPIVGYEDQFMQANRVESLWMDIVAHLSMDDPMNVCAGGIVFEWCDEWWKIFYGSTYTQELGGYDTYWNPVAQPDGYANEEWFGVVKNDRGKKEVFYTLQDHFGPGPNEPPYIKIIEPDGIDDTADGSLYAITWIDSDPDDNAMISLYYDSDDSGFDGTQIVSSVSEDDDGPDGYYDWGTPGIPDGAYYIYAVIDDGTNAPMSDYSPGMVTIATVPENEPPYVVSASRWPRGDAQPDRSIIFFGWGRDNDGRVVAYEWVLNGDTVLSTARFFRTTLPEGTHEISFRVQDDDSAWSDPETLTANVISPDLPSVRRAWAIPRRALAGRRVLFMGIGRDPDGYITGYEWVSDIDGLLSARRRFQTRTLSIGEHAVSLRVRDNDGNWSDPYELSVTIY